MSQPRFAPITASLLARKGHALPSMMMPPPMAFAPEPPPMPPVQHSEQMPLSPAIARVMESNLRHDPEPAALHAKKLFVALSHPDHERLAIAAVKTGLSRHQIVRDALDAYFEQLARDLKQDCRCVSAGCGGCSPAQ